MEKRWIIKQLNRLICLMPAVLVACNSGTNSTNPSLDGGDDATQQVSITISPNAPIAELVGLSQAVNVTFSNANKQSISNLQITSGLANLTTTNSGWSGPTSFSCPNLNSCQLQLTYAPTTTPQTGTLSLQYSYVLNGTLTNSTVSINYNPLNWNSNYTTGDIQYMTASTVEALNKSLASVKPAIDASNSGYLDSTSALGYFGPLGPWGPLSDVGPIFVANWYNNYAKYWINPLYNWTTYFSSINGPLTSAGPLGSNGPYTAENYYNNPALFNTNQFAANTRAFGLWSILGPIGPLGAVGPLGAIGPVGALGTIGLTTNSNGAYVNSGKQVVNEINVPYTTSQTRAFSPYANYTPNYVVKNAANNGTSFMVQDNFMYLSSANYTIHSNQDQIVTVLAVPTDEISTDVIYVSLYDTLGNLIASSNSTLFINYIEFTAPANTSYVVKLTASNLSLTPIYNLYITGSYNYLNQYYIQGDYIQHYKP